MARQKSIIKLDGTIGDITFYKSQDGYLAREKGGVSAERIKNDPKFQRTRENGNEFGRAGKAGKALRNSIRPQLQKASDSRMVSRLTKDMVTVIQADTTNPRGERTVKDGDPKILIGFDFNINGKLGTTLYMPWNKALDKAAGTASVSIPDFSPTTMVNAPGGTTHFRILAAAAAVDFDEETYEVSSQETAIMPWEASTVQGLNLDLTLPAGTPNTAFLVLGVEFLQEVNNEMYPLKNGAFNSLQIVEVV
ncbi:hypothetical protein SAMN05443429_11112 [Cruoricaptor ignavus]|uniref:Uncharacterized protein n=1 Tax=Cruoricaptor ignavus TaxID=1118202 RepID=A0A1M6H3L1_9FLAO|nr:hypothetical protein [Cruoricaptor ignavus]SHJ16739.1 hypothetical protein SAMN05443429_11112 [Cruoricaptor ignavus]